MPTKAKSLRTPYLICDICGGTHKADECDSNKPHEQVCFSGGDIYDDPSLLRFYQNDYLPPWGNMRRRTTIEEGPNWVIRTMIHMPKGAKVPKDLLSHKEKLEKAALAACSRDDYLYCIDHTANLVQEQWVDTLIHNRKWTDIEDEIDSEKYAFLQEDDKLPVDISFSLSRHEKDKIIEVLKNYKGAIAWSIADIKGIDPSFCTHKILMEDEYKPTVQP
ncbi:hypothetical protein Tco_1077207 [Tanacetum coccineum]